MNHRAARPFPLEKPRNIPWAGVNAPSPSAQGFADGGIIDGSVTNSSEATGGFKDGGKVDGKSFQNLVKVNGRLVEAGGDQNKLVDIGSQGLVRKKEALKLHKKQHPRKSKKEARK